MTSTDSTRNPALSDRDPRYQYFLAFLLRAGLGLHFLNHGLLGFLVLSQMGGFTGGTPYGQTYAQAMGVPTGMEAIYQVLPFVEIAVGFALILGFMTTPAALAAGILVLLSPVMQTFSLMINGMAVNRNMMGMPFQLQSLLSSTETTLLVLAALVIWLSPVRVNPWSLDGVMFRGRRRQPGSEWNPGANVGTSSWTGRAGTDGSQTGFGRATQVPDAEKMPGGQTSATVEESRGPVTTD